VAASRIVGRDDATVLATLERWLRDDYDLLEKRRQPGRRTWERRANRRPKLAKSLKGNRSASAVAHATEIGVTVTALGDGRTVVRLDADLSAQRRARVGGGVAIGVTGLIAGTLWAAVGLLISTASLAPLILGIGALPVIGCGLGGLATARSHREHAVRAQLGLEQLLDRLEHEAGGAAPALPPPPSFDETIDQMARGMKQVASAMAEVRKRAGI
jgi:hypothetical protein